MSLVVGKTYIGTGYNGSRILLRGPFDTLEEIRAGRAANQQLGHYDHATNPAVRRGDQAAANLQLMSEGIVACDWAADPRSNPYHHPDWLPDLDVLLRSVRRRLRALRRRFTEVGDHKSAQTPQDRCLHSRLVPLFFASDWFYAYHSNDINLPYMVFEPNTSITSCTGVCRLLERMLLAVCSVSAQRGGQHVPSTR
ncbi:hypothetical protein LTR70_004904 [Exophiala xenobiotica]|nr:hypothetical protein LTR70_004904 [Exophiala xenobiotica]